MTKRTLLLFATALACVSTDGIVAMAFVASSTTSMPAPRGGGPPDDPPPGRASSSSRMMQPSRRRRTRASSPPLLRPLRSSSTSYQNGYDRRGGYESEIDVSETAPRDMSSFETWAYECGIQRAEGLVLTNDDGTMTDVYASTATDAPSGTCVLYVPEEWILTSAKAMAELRTSDMDQAEKVRGGTDEEEEEEEGENGGRGGGGLLRRHFSSFALVVCILSSRLNSSVIRLLSTLVHSDSPKTHTQYKRKVLSSINANSELRHYYLLIKILVEYEKGEGSPWFPWLNS
jgi:hypothetical protein